MKLGSTGAGWIVLLAFGCSNGAEPALPPGGLFTADLSGARILPLTGSASAGTVYVETGARYVVRMIDASGDGVRSVTVSCPMDGTPEPGSHSLGDAECQARYFHSDRPPGSGSELADALTGTFTVTRRSDQEFAGTFTFQGELLAGADSLGPSQ